MSASDALNDMSEKLAKETDVRYDGVDVVVTRSPEAEGNVVTAILHDGEGGEDDGTIVGFDDQESFEEFFEKLIQASEADCVQLSEGEVEAISMLVEDHAFELPAALEEDAHRLRDRLSGGDS